MFQNEDGNTRALSLSLYSELIPTILSCTDKKDVDFIKYLIKSLLPTIKNLLLYNHINY